MKVLEKMTEMVSTGFTGVPMILGTHLMDIMGIVVKRLNLESTLLDVSEIDFDAEEGYYPGDFYVKAWELVLLPTTMEYLTATYPKAWFIKLYLDTKNKA
jgi:hypothetical protein